MEIIVGSMKTMSKTSTECNNNKLQVILRRNRDVKNKARN